jgi:hypothetical protein
MFITLLRVNTGAVISTYERYPNEERGGMEETNIPGKTKDEMAGRVAASRCLWDLSKRLRSRGHTPRERKGHECIESPTRRRTYKSSSPWMRGRKLTSAKTTSAAAGDAMGDANAAAGVANEGGCGRCDGEESCGGELGRGRVTGALAKP